MPGGQPLAAAHYFYLIKDDPDLEKLWARLNQSTAGNLQLSATMDLLESGEGPGGYCRIVHHVRGEDLDLCLVMLSDLSVIQVLYRVPDDRPLKELWQAALASASQSSAIVEEENLTIFGQSTVLLAPGDDAEESARVAMDLTGSGGALTTDVDPALGGGRPVLFNLLDNPDASRDLYLLCADDPSRMISVVFPQLDSAIKRLSRSSAYFSEQRSTIVAERSDVDREIGTLLHRQVVSTAGEPPDALSLEKQIQALSKMFGVLATDSLLVRQAGDQLERDIGRLERSLRLLKGGAGADEIGDHYLGIFRSDLEAARDEATNLDFSRQNAQAAIMVVRTHVELLRAGEEAAIQEQTRQLLSRSLVLQKERMALQVAAGFVEFVLVFYYVIVAWEHVVGVVTVEHITPLVRLFVVASFSASAAIGTHFLAQTLQSRSLRNRGLWVSAICLVLSLAAMVILSIAYY